MGQSYTVNVSYLHLLQLSDLLLWYLAPSSPVHSRRLLSARGGRMSSVDLPDEPDKSLSSNSASPCPSPVKQHSVSILIIVFFLCSVIMHLSFVNWFWQMIKEVALS